MARHDNLRPYSPQDTIDSVLPVSTTNAVEGGIHMCTNVKVRLCTSTCFRGGVLFVWVGEKNHKKRICATNDNLCKPNLTDRQHIGSTFYLAPKHHTWLHQLVFWISLFMIRRGVTIKMMCLKRCIWVVPEPATWIDIRHRKGPTIYRCLWSHLIPDTPNQYGL